VYRRRRLRKWKALATLALTAGAFAGPYAYFRPGKDELSSYEPISNLHAQTLLDRADITRIFVTGDARVAIEIVAATVAGITALALLLGLCLVWARRPKLPVRLAMIVAIAGAAVACARAGPSIVVDRYYKNSFNSRDDGLYCHVEDALDGSTAVAVCNLPYETPSVRSPRSTIRLAVFDLGRSAARLRFEREVQLLGESPTGTSGFLTSAFIHDGAGRIVVVDNGGVQALDMVNGSPVWSRILSAFDPDASGGPSAVHDISSWSDAGAEAVAGLDPNMQVVYVWCGVRVLLLNPTDGSVVRDTGCR
jgi:hypothetical protein